MSKKITLYQALKQSGLFPSKQEMTQAVNKGRVTVDGVVTKALQFQFSPAKKVICVDNKPLSFAEKKYFILNKPAGYSCQKNDAYPSVLKLLDLPEELKNTLFVVGRLDIPTTGLLLITNDGAFGERITNPKSKVPKTYHVLVKNKMTEQQYKALEAGVLITVDGEKYKTLPAKVEKSNERMFFLTLTEGKYRQVRKMVEAVGNKVVLLQRMQLGNLKLPKDLHEGHWKEYSETEIKKGIYG